MTPLTRKIIAHIRAHGPMTVGEFMQWAMGDEDHGYYRHGAPIGKAGDFITAPEISQVFGELLGVWSAYQWQRLGCPDRVHWVELGPGRGTLIRDAIRASAHVAGFHDAATLHLVDFSTPLRAVQHAVLADTPFAHKTHWWQDVSALCVDARLDAPVIIMANEFFDALPLCQFIYRTDDRGVGEWHERRVGLDGNAKICFVSDDGPVEAGIIPTTFINGPPKDGDVAEIAPVRAAVCHDIAARIAQLGGAAVIIDYGHSHTTLADTLQALYQHVPAPVLENIGAEDITAHVDFAALMVAVREAGVKTLNVSTQRGFLARMGAEARVAVLRHAAPLKATAMAAAVHRLMDDSTPATMGALFKVLEFEMGKTVS